MFKKTRNRLLFSYLLVLFIILSGFAIAIRIIFSRNLSNQLVQKLSALGYGLASGAEYEEKRLRPTDNEDIRNAINSNQGLQWFDLTGHLIAQQGTVFIKLPLSLKQSVQNQDNILSVTVAVIDDDTNQLVGYVRISESLIDRNQTLHNLGLGLAGGILTALFLSSVGSVWLTKQAMQPIETSFNQLKQFTADASHELRNPIMEIKSNAAVALKYPSGIRSDDEERFQFIVAAADQVTRLAEDLLLLARTDRTPDRSLERINLTQLLTQLIQRYEPRAAAKCLNLKVKLAEKLYVLGNQLQLTRLFSNLLDNAIYYTPHEGTVEVIADRDPHLRILIKDTGIGIAPEQIDRVFDRFWRADQSRTHWEGGSGLGLAIAQGIARTHGGKITVTSRLTQGSCFTVWLPHLS